MRAVGDFRGDFDAAIDRARREDEDVFFATGEAFGVHRVKVRVLGERRERTDDLAFELNAKEVEHVDARQNFVERVSVFDAEFGPMRRNEGRRAANDRFRAEFLEREDVRAGDAAVRDIADDRDRFSFERTEALAHRQDVEEALRRVFVRAVAGVDDRAVFEILRQKSRRAGAAVANDDRVDAHRQDVLGGVDERFAFRKTARRGGKLDDVGPEAASGEPEADASARRVFEKEVDDRFAVQQRDFATVFRIVENVLAETVGQIEQNRQFFDAEVLEPEEVRARPAGRNRPPIFFSVKHFSTFPLNERRRAGRNRRRPSESKRTKRRVERRESANEAAKAFGGAATESMLRQGAFSDERRAARRRNEPSTASARRATERTRR